MSSLYKAAGVDLQAGYESVDRIKKHVERTAIKGAIKSLGAFGGMFDLSVYGIKEPVLVSGTDGVGTKLLVAFMANQHDTIGIDAVAMCVNDVLVQGAMPIFFLDYVAVGKNDPAVVEAIVKGVADGCVQAACALIGGETAEMPDLYEANHYDIAGFCVGVVEKSKLITGANIQAGQVLIGIPSSGLHSNGFSLVRKILFKDNQIPLQQFIPALNDTLQNAILTPTKIYIAAIKKVLENNIVVNGMCHITGGGFYENLPRMLKDKQLQIAIKKDSFPIPPIFSYLQELGKINDQEMYNIFNMGIGFALVVDQADVNQTIAALNSVGEKGYVIGHIQTTHSSEQVCFV